MNDAANDPLLENPSVRETQDSAGAYGFTRSEIVILSAVGLVVLTLSIGQWIKRREAANVPPWRVENVLVDTLPGPPLLAAAPVPPSDDAGNPGNTLIEINTAAHDDLIRLPGIGLVLAGRILEERRKNGPFKDLVDLQRVRGIGPKKAVALAGCVRFSRIAGSTEDSLAEGP